MSGMDQSILNKSRKDKFLLIFTLPPILQKSNSKERSNESVDQDSLQFSVYGTVTPDIRVGDISVGFGGQVARFSSLSRPAYSEISVDFVIDNHFKNYFVLWKWLQVINDNKESIYNKEGHINPHVFKSQQDYQTTMTLYGLDEYNEKIIRFDYTKAFITFLSKIDWNYRTSDETDCSFSFVFNQLEVDNDV